MSVSWVYPKNRNGPKNNPMKTILLIGCKDQQEILRVLQRQQYMFRCVDTLPEAESSLSFSGFAAILLDIDTVSVTHPLIRNLVSIQPGIPLLCVSNRRLHPELKEAFHDHIYACLSKPVDTDELQYWLKSIGNNETDSREVPS
jgi:DNA-binding NtrC family response regulator